jgi:hypothetical protein
MIRPWNRVFAHKQFLFTAVAALLAAAPVLASAATEETATQVDKVFADLQKNPDHRVARSGSSAMVKSYTPRGMVSRA